MFCYGQYVKLVDDEGDTGLRGTIAGQPRPARDAKGPIVAVEVISAGATVYSAGHQHWLYIRRLKPVSGGDA